MSVAKLSEIGYRWPKPAWERAADRSMIFIVPNAICKIEELDSTSDPYFDRTQRVYQVFDGDGSLIDELHELQVERLLKCPLWRRELEATRWIRRAA